MPGVVTAALTTDVDAVVPSINVAVPPPEVTVVVKLAPATPAPATVIVSPSLIPVPLATAKLLDAEFIVPVVESEAEVHTHPINPADVGAVSYATVPTAQVPVVGTAVVYTVGLPKNLEGKGQYESVVTIYDPI